MNLKESKLGKMTVAAFIKSTGMPKRSMYRRLKKMHEMHGGVLSKESGRKMIVRLKRLKEVSALLSGEEQDVSCTEFEDLKWRLFQCERRLSGLSKRVGLLEK